MSISLVIDGNSAMAKPNASCWYDNIQEISLTGTNTNTGITPGQAFRQLQGTSDSDTWINPARGLTSSKAWLKARLFRLDLRHHYPNLTAS